MADRELKKNDLLMRCALAIPPVGMNLKKTSEIANVWIYVEQAIRKTKFIIF